MTSDANCFYSKMCTDKLVDALNATMNLEGRNEAEAHLSQLRNSAGLTRALFEIVVSNEHKEPLRQAGAIYLKNMMKERNVASAILEQKDGYGLLECTVDSIIHSPETISAQLKIVMATMIELDFPVNLPNIISNLAALLNMAERQYFLRALVVLYQLTKNYDKFKQRTDREALSQDMTDVLPILYDGMVVLMPDDSFESACLQKMILKLFHTVVQLKSSVSHEMPMEDFGHWTELGRQVVERAVPQEALGVDEEGRPQLVWWKCKKWALRLMVRILDSMVRYNKPGRKKEEYEKYIQYYKYIKDYAAPSFRTVFDVLNSHLEQEYVSPRVVHLALCYLECGTNDDLTSSIIGASNKTEVIPEIVYPLCCHSENDEELWQDHPRKFIQIKYPRDHNSLDRSDRCSTAIKLLISSMKYETLLDKTVELVNRVMNNASSTAQQLDGAMRMVGSLASDLLQREQQHTNELENWLLVHVFPRLLAADGFLRARAAWCIAQFSAIQIQDDANLQKVMELVLRGVFFDPDLPVKVQCALALKMLLTEQNKATRFMNDFVVTMQRTSRRKDNDTHGGPWAAVSQYMEYRRHGLSENNWTRIISDYIDAYAEHIIDAYMKQLIIGL